MGCWAITGGPRPPGDVAAGGSAGLVLDGGLAIEAGVSGLVIPMGRPPEVVGLQAGLSGKMA